VPDLSDVPANATGSGSPATAATGVFPGESPTAASSSKAAVRAAALAARRSLSAELRAQAAAQSQAELIALVREERPAILAGYAPMRTEPGGADLPEVLAAALGSAGRLLLPVLRPDLDLDWAYFADSPGLADSPVLAGSSVVSEPTGPRLGVTAITDAELIVVPAVAVDRSGVRLGRGGGSYDRALAGINPYALVVALLYDGELVNALPAEEHDQRVHAVILPSTGLISLGVR
jgi:5-formyltetrahydrofolate cyclo-ligase